MVKERRTTLHAKRMMILKILTCDAALRHVERPQVAAVDQTLEAEPNRRIA